MKQFHWHFGLISILAVGCVWSIDLGSFGLYGIGWRRISARRVHVK